MSLTIGQTITAKHSGLQWKVESLLGAGGQGEVYRVSNSADVRALKWYFPHIATDDQRSALEDLVRRSPPSNRFLWPQDLIESSADQTFGYLMPLREPRFKGLNDLMRGRTNPSFRALTTACFELVEHYSRLHTSGLAYRDISFGNVFFDPQSGEIRIADNDNVCVNGSAVSGVKGTPRFMAPEIVRGEASPSTDTDLFSLSVLLFYMLFVHHPLEGKREASIRCFDLPAMNKLYGSEPLFIFDPKDDSNRPLKGYQDNALIFWDIYPQFIRDQFIKAFTDGLQPEGRIRESTWRRVLAQLRDLIFIGPSDEEIFLDPLKVQRGEPHRSWVKGTAVATPMSLLIDQNRQVALSRLTVLTPYHLSGLYPTYEFTPVLATVVQHPADPAKWGLQNDSATKWTYHDVDGQLREVPPGMRVSLKGGLTINFGEVAGEIRI